MRLAGILFACVLALLALGCGARSGGDEPVRLGVAAGATPAGATPSRAAPSVTVGLERLDSAEAAVLGGKRLGLVVHAASVTASGRHAIDVFVEQGFEVARLFAPEHGLRGRAAAGEQVADGHDALSGLEVVSLYGERRQPTAADLADLDALVFDLQGAGVRFYTYASTLILCLEAAAVAGIDFVVLDRPNPLGGERVEGPLRAASEVVAESFVSLAPGPLVHGLTLGEMARHVNARRDVPARLTVVPMAGWARAMTWADSGRPWPVPSPNLRTAEAALAYPGVALLEATNVSEGRGTSAPFLMLGAPWLDAGALLAALETAGVPGFAFERLRFVPAASPAAPRPKYGGQACHGARVRVTDPARVEPYRLGVALLKALAEQPGFEWRSSGDALTRLLGTPALLEALRAGRSVDDIVALDARGVVAWRRDRRRSLLY